MLLTETSFPVSQVALDAGFCSQIHLARRMRRVLGVSPSALVAGRRHVRGADRGASSEGAVQRQIVCNAEEHPG